MPWKVIEGSRPDCAYEVIKADSGEHVACHPTEEKAKAHMAALYANTEGEQMMRDARAPIEHREVAVDAVNFPERIITIRAVPYERPAPVEYQGDVYTETFAVGSMDHLIDRPGRVRVNRDHNKSRTVGKVAWFHAAQADGLIADVRIAKTDLGDETLGLAAEDCLSSSIGFGALPAWQKIDKRNKIRRIERAHLDHISFVESPAYDNADVISVREAISKQLNDSELIDLLTNILVSARPPEQRSTPDLDQYIGDEVFRWADGRLKKPFRAEQ